MGELIRRLDYERRSRKSLMVGTGSGQRINKEYSTQVRAANEMEDRKKDLLIEEMEKHKKLFIDRHTYEKKLMIRFKNDLDAKSEDFNEIKFQQLRAQSARSRLQGNFSSTNIGPVTELLPRHYYRGETSAAVKFVESEEKAEKSSSSESADNDADVTNTQILAGGSEKEVGLAHIQSLQSWVRATKKPPSGNIRRRRMTMAIIETQQNRCLPARGPRRQSAPPRVVHALKPRETRSASLASRRSSRSSLTSAASTETLLVEEKEANSRSFRLLREAYKKKKIEIPNPKQDRLNAIKADHLSKTAGLYARTLEKFDELFSDQTLMIY